MARASQSTIASGVAAGTIARCSASRVSPFRPSSETVGRSGARLDRTELVTAEPRAHPLPPARRGSRPGASPYAAVDLPADDRHHRRRIALVGRVIDAHPDLVAEHLGRQRRPGLPLPPD
jgi:hypothetical protein